MFAPGTERRVRGSHNHFVSIKGLVRSRKRVLLLRKPDGTWDLPGGRLEPGEAIDACLMREFAEETGLPVRVGDIVGGWVRRRRSKTDVFCVAYACRPAASGWQDRLRLSDEHRAAALFDAAAIRRLRMVAGCRRTILASLDGRR